MPEAERWALPIEAKATFGSVVAKELAEAMGVVERVPTLPVSSKKGSWIARRIGT